MKRINILIITLIIGHSVSAVAGDVILRTSVTPERAWVGQRVIVHIDVLGEDGWAQIPTFGSLEVPGAYVMRTESQGIRLQETIEGIAYTGQRYELSLYPQIGGTIQIPAISVEVSIRSWGVDAEVTIQQNMTPATKIECNFPPGAEGLHSLISTPRLTAKQIWEPSMEDAQVGDAITRTIIFEAEDVSAMAFVPLQYPKINGLGIYPGAADVSDRSARGSLTGTRTEKVTYIFEQTGLMTIPNIVLPWWDIQNEKLKYIELPGISRQVDSGMVAGPDEGAVDSFRNTTTIFRFISTGIILVCIAGFVLRRRFKNRWYRWHEARADREIVYYRAIRTAITRNDSRATLRATMKWLDRINEHESPARLTAFLEHYGTRENRECLNKLLKDLVSNHDHWDGSLFGEVLNSGRKRWCYESRKKHSLSEKLPPMNRAL